ncbi:MAG: type II secretion system F family protein [bacterium]|nr:type II secretion system F family protein [bacterium]
MDSLAFVVGIVGVSMLSLGLYVGMGVVRSGERSGSRLASLQSREELLESNFNERALAPFASKAGRFLLRFTPIGWAGRAEKRLAIAGWFPRIDGNSWAAIRVIVAVVALVGWVALQGLLPQGQKLLILAIVAFAGIMGPEAVLNRKLEERKEQIGKDLPDVIDLLVISVEAGLGFEAALGRVVQNVPGELSNEFSRMLQETRVGVSRTEAMKALAERTDVDELNSFILAINQADQFGVSVSRMLRVQAEEIRVRRRQKIQERAFAAPVKMVFPLVLCIFPGIFVVLLAPAAMQIVDSFQSL